MRFVTFEEVMPRFEGKTVAVVGSGPTVLQNKPGFVDSHEVVVRVNNYKVSLAAGWRCDVHYAFYGSSIKNRADDLKRDGVTLCMCKCPDSKPIESRWHEETGRVAGIDFRKIYVARRNWWFCDTYVPTTERFLRSFELLGRHIPTSGFAAIIDVLEMKPASVYLTGFDFFQSGKHNVDERWKPGDPADPIGHVPDAEAAWLKANAKNYPLIFDAPLTKLLELQ